MAMSTRERVDTLENALKELAYAGRRTEMTVDKAVESVARLSEEMREFKVEMSAFKDEMGAFKDEMGEFKDEMGTFKDEMGAFKDDMRASEARSAAELQAYREEGRQLRREMFHQWGALANKMGSFVEDMVLPNFPRVLERYFGIVEVDDLLVRRRKPHPADRSRRKEFDLIAWTADTVFVNETKSAPTIQSFTEFVNDNESVYEFFPELTGRKLVKIGSALSIPPDVIAFLTRGGCYAMMLGDDTMDLVNFDAVRR